MNSQDFLATPDYEKQMQLCEAEILKLAEEYTSNHSGMTVRTKEGLVKKMTALDFVAGLFFEDRPRVSWELSRGANYLDRQSAGKSVLGVFGSSNERADLETFLPLLDQITEKFGARLNDELKDPESTHKDADRIRQDHPDLQHFFTLFYSF